MNVTKEKRSGIFLSELLCVMAILAIVMTMLVLLLNETMHTERMQAQNYDRLQYCKALADQFRADVARAEESLDQWNDYLADSTTLILKMKEGEHVLYFWHDNVLTRLAIKNQEETERALPVAVETEVAFLRPAVDAKLVRLRLTPVRHGRVIDGQAIEFAAALGGDLR